MSLARVILAGAVCVSPAIAAPHVAGSPQIPFSFVENRGQADPDVLYIGNGPNMKAWFRANGVTFQRGAAHMSVTFSRGSSNPEIEASAPLGATANYFRGAIRPAGSAACLCIPASRIAMSGRESTSGSGQTTRLPRRSILSLPAHRLGTCISISPETHPSGATAACWCGANPENSGRTSRSSFRKRKAAASLLTEVSWCMKTAPWDSGLRVTIDGSL